jgi:dipeptidyl aminopeptidase/acylaminoacyl peptidase
MIPEPLLSDDAPWKKRFRLPRRIFEFAQNAPSRMLIVNNESGKYELYAYDISTNQTVQLTRRPSGTLYGWISPDGNNVYYVDDEMGNETGHVVRIRFTGGSAIDMTPSLPPYTLVSPFTDGTSSHLGVTIPSGGIFSSYVIDTAEDSISRPRPFFRSSKTTFGPIFSQDGTRCFVSTTERNGNLDYSLVSFDTKNAEKLGELVDESSRIDPCAFSPLAGDQRLLASSNISGNMRPLIWDVAQNTRKNLDVAKMEGDVVAVCWSPDAKSVLVERIFKASTELWLFDLESETLSRVPHPEGTILSAGMLSRREVVISWQDSTHPVELLVIDLTNSALRHYLRVEKEIPESTPWRSGHFSSSDGQEIQCWYALPAGKGPFPTIFETHGGPTACQFNSFSPRSQCWLDHGFAYISVNYRGSTTFGKDFEKKINGDVGHWEVEDMVAARNWLTKTGISIPSQIFLTGWSYGGYLTLQAMGVRPELWAGGMGGVVVADWVSEYDDEPDAMRGYDIALHGGTPSDKKEEYEKASPITYVQNLSAPVLIIQGRNDMRDPPRQVELYEAKARSLKKEVKVIWFDTGHAGSGIDIELAIRHQEAMLRWLYDVIRSGARQ